MIFAVIRVLTARSSRQALLFIFHLLWGPVAFGFDPGDLKECMVEPDANGHVVLPEGMKSIPVAAFAFCEKLISIDIHDGIQTIDAYSFYHTGNLLEVRIPDSVVLLGDHAFPYSGINRAHVGNGLEIIEHRAFHHCKNLTSVILGDGLETIGNAAFKSCSALKALVLPQGLKKIGGSAFEDCDSLVDINLNDTSLLHIGEAAFIGCESLQSVVLPDSVTHLGSYAFQNDKGLISVELSSSLSEIGIGVFQGNTKLESAIFRSSAMNMSIGIFDGCIALREENILFNSSLTNIGLGFAEHSIIKVACGGESVCGCQAGYGNLNLGGNQDKYFNCVACPSGKTSIKTGRSCNSCPPGRWSSARGSPSCSACEPGKYNDNFGASSALSCKICSVGYYAPTEGRMSCLPCTPGSCCPKEGMILGTPCSPGYFTNSTQERKCSPCPAGRYQREAGQAVCSACPKGKWLGGENGTSLTQCLDCPTGTYGPQEGLGECSPCAKGSFQEKEGQSQCQVCSEVFNDQTLTSNEEHTACITNKDLLSKSLVEMLFNDGVALIGTFTVALVFVVIAMFMAWQRQKHVNTSSSSRAHGQLTHVQVVLKSFFPGLSFASEFFLIIGLLPEIPSIAGTLLGFRLLHFVVGAWLNVVLYGNKDISHAASMDLPFLIELRSHMDHKFCVENIPHVVGVILMSLCDVMSMQFMPWKDSRFHTSSKGFPTMVLMKFCMATEIVQMTASAICQILYLLTDNVVNDPISSTQAKILFTLSIGSSVGGAFLGLVYLCLKGQLLRDVERDDPQVANLPPLEEGRIEGSQSVDVVAVRQTSGNDYETGNPLQGAATKGGEDHIPSGEDGNEGRSVRANGGQELKLEHAKGKRDSMEIDLASVYAEEGHFGVGPYESGADGVAPMGQL